MVIEAKTIEEYIDKIPDDRKEAFRKIWDILEKNLPKELEATIQYNMPSFVIPHNIYPKGYHVNPEEPLGFVSLGNQKNNISLYHMGIYSDEKILDWFVKEYPKYSKRKLDMGKSCIRFKNMEDIPYELIEELSKKISVEEFINNYEKVLKR